MALTARFRELMRKYGKVAVVVHCSVSAVSITGLYVAIKNNVDIEPFLAKVGLSKNNPDNHQQAPNEQISGSETVDSVFEEKPIPDNPSSSPERNRTAELAASSGGAFALAILCNKALFPVRVPITVALTPPIARFLARRRIIKTHT